MKKIYYNSKENRYCDASEYDPKNSTNFVTVVNIAPLGSTFELWRCGDRHFAFVYNNIELKNGAVNAKRKHYAKISGAFPLESATLYEQHIDKEIFDGLLAAYHLTPIEI